jgi:hypothetical protein
MVVPDAEFDAPRTNDGAASALLDNARRLRVTRTVAARSRT